MGRGASSTTRRSVGRVDDSTPPPSGWYEDPWDSSRVRYWDGVAWTSTCRSILPPEHQQVVNGRPTYKRMIGLAVAGVLTLAWGMFRYTHLTPWGMTVCPSGVYLDAASDIVIEAVLTPWILLVTLALLGQYVYILEVRHWPEGHRTPFKVVGLLGWSLVLMLNPVFALIWAQLDQSGYCY